MYSPILKNRQGEMLAFRHLSTPVRQNVMPVFDVAAPTKNADKAKATKYVERNIVRAEKAAAGVSAVFVDSSELDPSFRLPGEMHPLTAAAAAVANAGSLAIPVTGLHRDTAHNAAAMAAMKSQSMNNLCLRLDATDVSTATLTLKRIDEFLEANAIDPDAAYLLLDLQGLFGQQKEPLVKAILRFLKLLESKVWSGIILGGYGIPDQLSTAISTKAQGYIPRLEQKVFDDVVASHELNVPLWFADYTSLTPSAVELDWRLVRKVMSPKALYALDESWFVVRGGAFSSHPQEYKQYYLLAKEIVALEEFCGEGYSYGDKYISDRANEIGTPGSPSSWITACVNHHITLMADRHAK